MLNLHIDTSNRQAIVLILNGTIMKEKRIQSAEVKSQQVVAEIETFMAESESQFKDLTSLTVATGPGSFTGLRVGTIVGQTLSLLLEIPINGQEFGSLPKLEYGPDLWKLSG